MKAFIIGLAAVIVIGGSGYLIFHKTPKPTTTANSTTSNAPAVNNAVLVTKKMCIRDR